MKEFLKRIDFPLLQEQKQRLLEVIENTTNHTRVAHLAGILNMIDMLQEEAVAKYGYEEDVVFKITKE